MFGVLEDHKFSPPLCFLDAFYSVYLAGLGLIIYGFLPPRYLLGIILYFGHGMQFVFKRSISLLGKINILY